MADDSLLQQEVILLNLRIIKLEDDKKKLSEKLENTEKVCRTMEWKWMGMETRYHKALDEIEKLKCELIDALGSDVESDSD